MKQRPALLKIRAAVGLLAIAALGAISYMVVAGNLTPAHKSLVVGQTPECDSCSLHHKDLAARRAALSNESQLGK